MTDCGGYKDFKSSHGMKLTPRLRDIYNLVYPSQGERILDIGCGRGELTYALAMAGAQAEGIDYSNDAITIAKRSFMGKCETLRYTCADIFKIDNLDSFDKIIMADVVEHIEQDILEKIFRKISLSLNENGCLIIHTAPNREYYERTYPQLREQVRRLGCWKPRNPRSYYEQLMHINEQTPNGLRAALEKYFQYVKVWTGSVREAETEKTMDESCMDIDIFAIACQESGLIERQISNAVKRPEWNGCRINLEAENVVMPAGECEKTVNVTLTNTGMEVLSSQRIYPINLSYHLLDQDENMLLFDGERTLIRNEIRPGMTEEMQLRLVIPSTLACRERCVCRITLVAEGCFWFDQEGENKKDILIYFKQND